MVVGVRTTTEPILKSRSGLVWPFLAAVLCVFDPIIRFATTPKGAGLSLGEVTSVDAVFTSLLAYWLVPAATRRSDWAERSASRAIAPL